MHLEGNKLPAAEQRLCENEARYRMLTETMKDVVWVVDAEALKYLYVSPSVQRLRGYSVTEVMNETLDDSLDSKDAARFREQLAEAASAVRQGRRLSTEFRTTEVRQRHRDGRWIWTEVVTRFWLNPETQVVELHGVSRDISERQRAQAAERALLEQLTNLSRQVPGLLYQIRRGADGRTRYTYLGDRAGETLGLGAAVLGVLQQDAACLLEHIHPDDRDTLKHAWQATAESKRVRLQYRVIDSGGETRWLDDHATVVGDEDGSSTWHGYIQDVSERRQAIERLTLAASVFQTTHEGIMITDAGNRIVDVNPAFTGITGYSREEVLGKSPTLLSSGRQDASFYADLWAKLKEQGYWRGEVWNRHKDGHLYAELLAISLLKDEYGQVSHHVAVFSDISQIKAHQEQLARIAHYDALTGIPNRRLLEDRMAQAIARSQRHGSLLAVCYLDLDGFKPVNDTWGHAVGDELLIEISRRLLGITRAADTLARLGGDEFVMLIGDLRERDELFEILQRTLHTVATPVDVGVACVQVSASIGVSVFPEDATDADSLLRQADAAMYSAKQNGRGRYQFFAATEQRRNEAEQQSEQVGQGSAATG